MTTILLGCEEIEVEVPTLPTIILTPPMQWSIELDPPSIAEVVVSTPSLPEVVIETLPSSPGVIVLPIGGPPGPPGPGGDQELFDRTSPPPTPPDTYLRFERDIDGDVQAIYLGTVT